MEKTCYVAMPFGRKTDYMSGRVIDFDHIYFDAIRPAVEEAGLKCVRADEVVHSGIVDVPLFSLILTSDVMIADLSTSNPNVLYELGIRHAARPHGTILLYSDRQFPLNASPFDTASIINYEVGGGDLIYREALRLRDAIRAAVRAKVEKAPPTIDSPIYVLLQELIPPTLPPSLFEISAATPTQDVDHHVNELKRLRDESAWDALVQKAEGYPEEVKSAPEVAQLLALALNRRGRGEDTERAIKVIKDLIDRTDGDGESYGILGRIYKDRYERNKVAGDSEAAAFDLEAAINHYRAGFEKQPDDYYPGVNVVTLLLQRRDAEARQELEEILPRVKEAVRKKMTASSAGFWELATALHLSSVSCEWEEAEGFLDRLLVPSTPPWMIETSARDLQSLESSMERPADLERLRGIVARLRSQAPSGEGRYA